MNCVLARLCGALAAALLAPIPTLAQTAARPSAEVFFRDPQLRQLQLSPSGRWLAMTAAIGGKRTGLVVLDLREDGAIKPAVQFDVVDIRRFDWVNDERLVFSVIDREEGSGEQRYAPGLFSVRRDGSELRTLVKPGRFVGTAGRPEREPLEYNHRLLHVPADGSEEVIVGEHLVTAAGEPAGVVPKRLNVATGLVRSIGTGTPAQVSDWLFDAKGQARVAASYIGGRVRFYWREPGSDTWQTLAEFNAFEAPFSPRTIDAAGQLYVTAPERPQGTRVLTRFDFQQRRPQSEPMVRTPGFDFAGQLVTETPAGKVLGVRVVTDAESTVWFDERLKALQQDADKRLPGLINRLSCRRCEAEDMTVLIESWSDRHPGLYTVYQADKKSWRNLGPRRPGVDPAAMGRKDFDRIRARDGRDLPVWVTFPSGATADTPRPAVVLVHGGPWARSSGWRWDEMAQFLASRGYVVIEPDYRGTLGYGHQHFGASFGEWGLSMQDDIADALLWAVKQGWVDAKRACIAGASYGGYATLMGLVRHPELYRCGVAWAAVTDPRLMYEWSWDTDQPDDVRHYTYPKLIGDPVADAQRLRDTAPVEQAARIKAPLLLAMGGQDRRVPLKHGIRMRDAMRAAGNEPEWIVYDSEGHGWLKLETRLDFAGRMERFLARHLK